MPIVAASRAAPSRKVEPKNSKKLKIFSLILPVSFTFNVACSKRVFNNTLDRNCSEGKFGEGKRRYGLNLIKAKLQETSETAIIMNLIVMNLAHLYSSLFVFFSKSFFRIFKAIFLLKTSRFWPAAA